MQALRSYLEGGKFQATLEAVGDVHFAAAADALKSRGTRETLASIREARGHLRTAHHAYRRIWDIPLRRTIFVATLGGIDVRLLSAAIKDCIACSLIATTYAYFDEREDVEDFLHRAEVARRYSSKCTLWQSIDRRSHDRYGIPKMSAYLFNFKLSELDRLITAVEAMEFDQFSMRLRDL
jgi:hypothetical protein